MRRKSGTPDLRGERQIPRSARRLAALCLLAALGCAALIGLGTWQVERLSWKRDLIRRVDERIHAAPVPAPGPADWPAITRAGDEYRHVSATGAFRHDRETLVRAVTERGPGFWVLAPLARPDGSTVLVNRGFVTPELRDRAARRSSETTGETTVTGLLRITAPGGALLRANDPAGERWYSRDVAAIAAARGLSEVAPYFIDADATPAAPDGPVGGLTVVAFPNNHLLYAIIWYALALMLASGTAAVIREERVGLS